jgi:hypothetical protein
MRRGVASCTAVGLALMIFAAAWLWPPAAHARSDRKPPPGPQLDGQAGLEIGDEGRVLAPSDTALAPVKTGHARSVLLAPESMPPAMGYDSRAASHGGTSALSPRAHVLAGRSRMPNFGIGTLIRIPVVSNHLSIVMAGRSAGHPRLACGEKGVDGRDRHGHDAESAERDKGRP